eukprot:1169656-Rhodomonas_salina.1
MKDADLAGAVALAVFHWQWTHNVGVVRTLSWLSLSLSTLAAACTATAKHFALAGFLPLSFLQPVQLHEW